MSEKIKLISWEIFCGVIAPLAVYVCARIFLTAYRQSFWDVCIGAALCGAFCAWWACAYYKTFYYFLRSAYEGPLHTLEPGRTFEYICTIRQWRHDECIGIIRPVEEKKLLSVRTSLSSRPPRYFQTTGDERRPWIPYLRVIWCKQETPTYPAPPPPPPIAG